jgi:rhamnogalacturonyl hydrolase YesR
MLGAALLARAYQHTRKTEYLEVATSAMEYSCSRQRADGSWWYAEDPKYHWIDNFHTGYNLDSLKSFIESTGDRAFEEHLRRGLAFFKKAFIERSGRPKYYHNRAYPIDSQCAAQAIDTLANFAQSDEESLDLAVKVANWTIDNMQDEQGFFYYRQYPLLKAKTPMLHWAQATTYKALAVLALQLTRATRNRHF